MVNSNTSKIQFSNKKKEFDIYKRIFNFVVNVLNFIKILPKTVQNLTFINQITRSVTSMGANAQEGDGSSTRKEFFHSFIVKKETKETNYWLQLMHATNPGFQAKMIPLINEGKEIEAIISAIVQKSKQ